VVPRLPGPRLCDAATIFAAVLRKARFWDTWATALLNPSQRAIINRLLDGWQGKLTSSKWVKITKCSQDTALHDVDGALCCGIPVKEAAVGRNTSYAQAVLLGPPRPNGVPG